MITKHIVISEKNYRILASLGTKQDTFDDIMTRVLSGKKN